jgi:hypothetical protein
LLPGRWDVPECRALVGRLADALLPGGRLLVHDVFLDDDLGGPLPVALYSAALFALTEGRASSAAEYRAWLIAGGLRAFRLRKDRLIPLWPPSYDAGFPQVPSRPPLLPRALTRKGFLMAPAGLFLIEFNELCPALLDDFIGRGWLPNFRRLYESSAVFTTDAGEQPPNLEPWIQWPTVHSGLPFAEHRAFHLGDGRRLEHLCLAELLSEAGVTVGVFGSMNLNYRRLRGYLVPDPWDKGGAAWPDWLAPFYRTIARQVQESSGPAGLSKREALSFGWFLVRHGLTAGTAWALARQLLAERRDGGLRWQRALLLDRLQYDVFRRLNRAFDVRFATFFCNSTAHFQHYHWRNMEPGRFAVGPPEGDHPSLRDAIPEGYRAMDRLLGRFLRDYPDAVLVLCTALSQQPWTDTTKCTFRPRRFDHFLEFARVSVPAAAVKPVMAEQFHVECLSGETAAVAAARLEELTVDGRPLMHVERSGSSLFAGCRVNDPAVLDRPVVRRSDGGRLPFGELFHMVHTMRSGRHHPDGVLWVRTGRHRLAEGKVSLTDIAPTVLKHFGVAQPARMRGRPLPV